MRLESEVSISVGWHSMHIGGEGPVTVLGNKYIYELDEEKTIHRHAMQMKIGKMGFCLLPFSCSGISLDQKQVWA